MTDDRLHAESLPGGGVRVQGVGIDIRVSREAIERCEREGGLGFNYAMTPLEHEALDRIQDVESPIRSLLGISVALHSGSEDKAEVDEPREGQQATDDENCDECGTTLQHIDGEGFRCPNPGCIRK